MRIEKDCNFFSPPSATKNQVKAVREELVKFMTFQMLTNMFRERSMPDYFWLWSQQVTTFDTRTNNTFKKAIHLLYQLSTCGPFFLCTMEQSSTTTFFEHLLIYLLGHSFLINQTFRSSNNLLISMLSTKTKTPKETKPNPTHIKITKLLPLKQTAQVMCQNLIFQYKGVTRLKLLQCRMQKT